MRDHRNEITFELIKFFFFRQGLVQLESSSCDFFFEITVQSSDLEWARAGDEITLWCEEASQPQAIGSLQETADEKQRLAPVYLTLPRDAFAEFWAAASDADSALRNITIKFEDAMMEYAITDVVLLEGTPTHPVVAELRFMQRWLRLPLIGLLAAAAVLVVFEVLKVAWVFWHRL